MNDHMLEMVENKPVGLYNFKEDRFLEENLVEKDTIHQEVMEEKLKAIIQSYNARLIDNKMVVK